MRLGVLVAADAKLPGVAVAGIAIALGLATGDASAPDLARASSAGLGAAGGTTALFVLVSLLAGHVVALRAPAACIAVRVVGSWIAASGLLMLGWALRT